MVFPVEQAHFRGTAIALYGAEHGETLGHIAAVVLVGVDEQDGRFAGGRVLERGLLPEKLRYLFCSIQKQNLYWAEPQMLPTTQQH